MIGGLGRLDLRHRRRRRPRPQFLSVGRDGRRGHDRARHRAGAAEAAGGGDHRRRRNADGNGQLCHRRPAKAGQPHRSSCWIMRSTAKPVGRRAIPRATTDLVGSRPGCGIADARAIATMAEIEAFAPQLQDVSSGPAFASRQDRPRQSRAGAVQRDGPFIVTASVVRSGFSRSSYRFDAHL